jgi:nitroreductase
VLARHYHDLTKHQFDRFAQSLGYLDWASQPDPFRRYVGAPLTALSREPRAVDTPYAALFSNLVAPAPFTDDNVAEFLRCALGLSAWKVAGQARWSLRVNPSSGNLHPTEAHLIRGGCVQHYAPLEHALEERSRLAASAWDSYAGSRTGFLVALTSIHWREAWKYGVRAFRYCQHDAGHAIAALRVSASRLGWRLCLLPRWSHDAMVVAFNLPPGDGAEAEEPECVMAVAPDLDGWRQADPEPLVEAARAAQWSGEPNRLSSSHVEWPPIDEIARATRCPGAADVRMADMAPDEKEPRRHEDTKTENVSARRIILQRRSAVAFDGRSSLPRGRLLEMLGRLMPGAPPWDAIDWPPQVHLALFIHRVDGMVPGAYAFLRDPSVASEWRAAMRPEFLWERDAEDERLFLLLPFDMTWPANRVSCDQDIAADGFFSLGMVARFEAALHERGEWFYRRLFWEAGIIGQVLYLEAEAAGARATGIGCFYDDPVHDMLGLSDMAWQSLYHFSMGVPVEDLRITNEPGYTWESMI